MKVKELVEIINKYGFELTQIQTGNVFPYFSFYRAGSEIILTVFDFDIKIDYNLNDLDYEKQFEKYQTLEDAYLFEVGNISLYNFPEEVCKIIYKIDSNQRTIFNKKLSKSLLNKILLINQNHW